MERLKKALCLESTPSSAELLRLLQQIAAEDATRRGGGQALLLSRGCTWVLVKNRLTISRWPEPGEELELTTWPLTGRFGLYPRCIELRDGAGELLVKVESIWAIMDVESRTMLRGEERGIRMEGVEEGRLAPQRRLTVPEGGEVHELIPQPEQIDENGHLNNAAYLDAAEALLPPSLRGRRPRAIAIDYEHEIPAGSRAEVRVAAEGDSCFFEGILEGRVCFRLREDFAVQDRLDKPVASIDELE